MMLSLQVSLCLLLVSPGQFTPVKFVFDVDPKFMQNDRAEKSLVNTFPFNQQESKKQDVPVHVYSTSRDSKQQSEPTATQDSSSFKFSSIAQTSGSGIHAK